MMMKKEGEGEEGGRDKGQGTQKKVDFLNRVCVRRARGKKGLYTHQSIMSKKQSD